MSDTKIQLRGNCPCCGSDQAVVKGRMSKHGYTTKHGWFEGVCPGHQFAPMQQDRSTTDKIVAQVRKECDELDQTAADLNAGKVFPTTAKEGPGFRAARIPFSEASKHQQEAAVREAAYAAEGRARAGRSFARDMEALADRVHGEPLKEVRVAVGGPAPIVRGEQRTFVKGGVTTVLTVQYQQGARVYWINERGFKGWTGTQAWRKLPLA